MSRFERNDASMHYIFHDKGPFSGKVDFYNVVHPGIRLMLTKTLHLASQACPSDTDATEKLLKQHAHMLDTLKAHAEIEDKYFHNHLGESDIGVKLSHSHAKHDKMLEELEVYLEGIRQAQSDSYYKYYLNLAQFIGDYFLHLDDEEREAMPYFRKHFSEKELREMFGQFLSEITIDRARKGTAFMLPALNVEMRAEKLAGISDEKEYQYAKTIAQKVLTEEGYLKTIDYLSRHYNK